MAPWLAVEALYVPGCSASSAEGPAPAAPAPGHPRASISHELQEEKRADEVREGPRDFLQRTLEGDLPRAPW
eukprot:1015135-Pyramimonas_sp.AAC.1